jgi:hypothetical protein
MLRKRLVVCLPLLSLSLALALPAGAQVRITGSITGVVTDAQNAVIPGAAVVLKDEQTGVQRETVTNTSGGFSFPDLHFGTYQLTVTLSGFQTAVFNKVIVDASGTTDLRVKLQLGAINEAITVEGVSPVLEMTSNRIASTLDNKQITELPLPGRNAFTFARLVPGAATPSGTGSTHFNGMPGGTINPTIDGVNNSSNGWKSGGTSFFGTVPARLGAIEQVTVESAGLSGDSGSQGGVNLQFVTRRGTSRYRGSVFEQLRNESLNANSFSNNARQLPKNELRRHDFGGNFGGPLVPTGRLRDKLFIFINYEEEYIPQSGTRTQTLLTPEAQQGIFRYQTAAGEQRTANLLDIARQAGFEATPDPTIAALIAKQQEARQFGVIEPNTSNVLLTERLSWIEPDKQVNYYPTARLDAQITPTLAWMGSWNLYRQDNQPRRLWPLPNWPEQVDAFVASWWITSTGLNWTVNANTHNEFRYGIQHSGDTIPGRERRFYELNGLVNGLPARFTLPLGLNNLANDAAPITGRHYITTITDTLTFLRGNHQFKVGGNFRSTNWRDTSFDGPGTAGFLGLPRYSIGTPTGDPVQSVFSSTTMPGIQNADLGNARALYALITGRISQVQTGKIVDPETLQYSDTAYNENWTAAKFGGVFVQDSWRMNPNFTLNYGLRWEFMGVPYSHTGTAVFPDYANLLGPSTGLFQPGVLNGQANPIMRRGTHAAKTDWVNPGPRVGFAWSPNFSDGILAKLFGAGQETVIRGGWDITYYDEGTNMFAFNPGSNPGRSQTLLLQPGAPGFAPGALTLRTPLPPFEAFPLEYKDVWSQSEFTFSNTSIATMDPDIKTPNVQAWNIGVQRQIMKDTVVEVRYLGNRGNNVWRSFNLNEVNIFENGFLQEFQNAQQNLAINQAAGVSSFANRGLPGQVALPIFDAAFGARGSQAALPASQGFTNGGFITNLSQGEAGRLASSLAGTLNYACRMFGSNFGPCADRGYSAPGPYPINFFKVNPFIFGQTTDARLVDDTGFTRYHALQLQLRRRYGAGVSATVNYTLAKNTADIWADNSTQDADYRTLRDTSLDEGPAGHDVRHVLQAFGTYDLPFGRDRRVRIENPVLDAVLGGWTLGGILTAQSGTVFRLTSDRWTINRSDSGVVLKGGMTVEELQRLIRISPGPGFNRYFVDPKLIGPDGRANPEFLGVPTTPGEFGQFVYLRSKATWGLDASLNKLVRLPRGLQLLAHITATNVLNHPVWRGPGFLNNTSIQSTSFGQVGGPSNSARELYVRFDIRF